MQSNLISIIIPLYNGVDVIDRCVDSLLCQTYQQFEIIIINDGSKDHSLQHCQERWGNHDKIRILDKENGGVSSARNMGLKAAQGEFITFVDSDDWVKPDYLSCLYENLIADGADMATVDYEIISRDMARFAGKVDTAFKSVANTEEATKAFFDARIATGILSKLYRRSVLEGMEFPIGVKVGEDGWFIYHSIRRAKKVSINPQKLYCYWMDNENSATNSYYSDFHFDADYFVTNVLRDVQKNAPNLLPFAANFFLQQAMRTYIGYTVNHQEKNPQFAEVDENMRLIFRYADKSGRCRKYQIAYLLHKVCPPLFRMIIKKIL